MAIEAAKFYGKCLDVWALQHPNAGDGLLKSLEIYGQRPVVFAWRLWLSVAATSSIFISTAGSLVSEWWKLKENLDCINNIKQHHHAARTIDAVLPAYPKIAEFGGEENIGQQWSTSGYWSSQLSDKPVRVSWIRTSEPQKRMIQEKSGKGHVVAIPFLSGRNHHSVFWNWNLLFVVLLQKKPTSRYNTLPQLIV